MANKEKLAALDYVQQHIDALLSKDKGKIEGLEMVVQILKDQMAFMQNVLAVAVAKIPEVNLENFTVNMPSTAPNNQGNKQQEQKKQEQKN